MDYEIKTVYEGDEWANYDVTYNGETLRMCYTGCGPNPGYYTGYLHDGNGRYLGLVSEKVAARKLVTGSTARDRGARY